MPRRPAAVTQADVARTIRAAKQAGAESVMVHADGRIEVVLKDTPAPASPAPTSPDDDPEAAPKEIVL